MKLFQNKNSYLLNAVVAILFMGIVSIIALPVVEEWQCNSGFTSELGWDLEKKNRNNPLPEKDALEEITEICFGNRATINYCLDFFSLLKIEFLVDGLPNCTCDVYIPPPKQESFTASQLVG